MRVQSSAAKKKRRPFTVKNGEQVTHIFCTLHPNEVATFYCAICGDPYDEACVGCEEGETTVCIACGIAKNRPEKNAPKWLPMVLVAIALIISISNGTYYYINQSHQISEVNKPQLTKQVRDIVLCRQRLEKIAQEAAYYHQTTNVWPSGLDVIAPLFEDKTMLTDPLTLFPFEVAVENGQFTVYSPSPEAYGLKELYAVPGKPAKMEYLDN